MLWTDPRNLLWTYPRNLLDILITRCCGLCPPLLSGSLLRLSTARLKQGAHNPDNSDHFDDFSAKSMHNYNHSLKTSCYTVQPSPASASNFIVLEKVKPLDVEYIKPVLSFCQICPFPFQRSRVTFIWSNLSFLYLSLSTDAV